MIIVDLIYIMPALWIKKVFGPKKFGGAIRVFSVSNYYVVPNFAIDWK